MSSELHWYDQIDFDPASQQPEMIRPGDKGEEVKAVQRRLRKHGHTLSVDGVFGNETEKAVRRFQRDVGLSPDGIVGPATEKALHSEAGSGKELRHKDVEKASEELDVSIAAVLAVTEVESRGAGFFNADKPAILFERHVFWDRLKEHGIDPHKHVAGNEDILNTSPGGYQGGIDEYERLRRAQAIHEQAALESASWGAFQIMGYHWEALGYDGVQAYVDAMRVSEGEHLMAFVAFVQADGVLLDALREQAWGAFAERYNGPNYKKNRYDVKLKSSFDHHQQLIG